MAALARNVIYSILCMGFLLVPIIAKPYSKYGRNCGDIGCASSDVCVMQHESCNYGAQEGADCGRYPTCKRREGVQTADRNLTSLIEDTRLTSSSRDSSVASNISHSNNKPMIFDGSPAQGTGDGSASTHNNTTQNPNYPLTPEKYEPNVPKNIRKQPGYPIQPAYNPQQPYKPQQPCNPQNPYPQNTEQYPGQNTNQFPNQPKAKRPSVLDEFVYGKGRRCGASSNLFPINHTSNHNVLSSSDTITRTSSTPTRSESGDLASFFGNPNPRPNPSPSLYPRLPTQPDSPAQPQYPSPQYPRAPSQPVSPAQPQYPSPQYPAPQYPRQPTGNAGQPSYPRQPSINPAAPSTYPGQSGGYDSFSNVNRGGYVPPGYGGASSYNPYGGYNAYGGQQPANTPQRPPGSIIVPPRGTSGSTNSNSDTGFLSSLSGYLGGGGGNAGSGISTSDVAGLIGGVIGGNRGSPAKPAASSSSGPVDGILSGISGYLGGNTGSAANNNRGGSQPPAGNAAGGSTFDSLLSGVSGYLGSGGNTKQGQSSQVGDVIGGLIGGNKGASQTPDLGNIVGGLIGNRGSFGAPNAPAAPQTQNTGTPKDDGVLSGIGDFFKNNAGTFISSAINGGGVNQREIITNKKNFGLFSENPSSSSSNSDLNVAASNRASYPSYPTQSSAYRGNYNYNNNNNNNYRSY